MGFPFLDESLNLGLLIRSQAMLSLIQRPSLRQGSMRSRPAARKGLMSRKSSPGRGRWPHRQNGTRAAWRTRFCKPYQTARFKTKIGTRSLALRLRNHMGIGKNHAKLARGAGDSSRSNWASSSSPRPLASRAMKTWKMRPAGVLRPIEPARPTPSGHPGRRPHPPRSHRTGGSPCP